MFCRTINGNALNIPLADKSVQTCITSPPYWGLRDYGTAEWVGGSGNCDHVDKAGPVNNPSSKSTLTTNNGKGPLPGDKYSNTSTAQYKTQCPKCGAIRKDAQLGLEQTPDEFLTNMVNVFREVWRVLKDDGVIWVNMGDSYASNKSGSSQPQETLAKSGNNRGRKVGHTGLRDKNAHGLGGKNLLGMPWRLALALQSDGWILRSDIIWHKPNPMPESVTDRPTKSHEYVFLLSKQQRYYYDADAVREAGNDEKTMREIARQAKKRGQGTVNGLSQDDNVNQMYKWGGDIAKYTAKGRNKRTVWTVATQPYSSSATTSRLRRVSKDAVSDDSLHIVLPSCSVHADSFAQVARVFCDEHVNDLLNRIIDTYDCLAQDYAFSHHTNGATHGHLVSNLVNVPLQYSPTAIDRNTENYRMARALGSMQPYIPFFERIDHTADKLKSLALFVQHLCIYANSILLDDLPANHGQGIPHHIVGKSLNGASMAYDNLTDCSCLYYEYYTKKPDHFATFPPKLIEPMILAGSKPGDIVLDPFAGTSTVGTMAIRHNRSFVGVELNPEYIKLAQKRTATLQPMLIGVG